MYAYINCIRSIGMLALIGITPKHALELHSGIPLWFSWWSHFSSPSAWKDTSCSSRLRQYLFQYYRDKSQPNDIAIGSSLTLELHDKTYQHNHPNPHPKPDVKLALSGKGFNPKLRQLLFYAMIQKDASPLGSFKGFTVFLSTFKPSPKVTIHTPKRHSIYRIWNL